MLSADLIERLNERAADPMSRTDAAGFDYMIATDTQVMTVKTLIGTLAMGLGAPAPRSDRPQYAPAPTPAPASQKEIAAAERRLGFSFPDDLVAIYRYVANGGVGPSDGVMSLERACAFYEELGAAPQGEYGEEWPDNLFPLIEWDMGCDSYDIVTGEIVRWSPEVLVEEPGKGAWAKSFKTVSKNFADYLENWLSAEPPSTPGSEPLDDRNKTLLADGVDPRTLKELRESIRHMREAGPEVMETFGTTSDDLPRFLVEARGLDPDVYLKHLE